MTRGQVPAIFSKARALATLAEMRHSRGQASVLREKSPDENCPWSFFNSALSRADDGRG